MNVPVFPTWNALDIVTSDYSHYCGRVGTYGGAGRNFGIQNSDLLMTIGCRFLEELLEGMCNLLQEKLKNTWLILIHKFKNKMATIKI